ncbi:MAG: sensor histidine kinase [Blautia sp.]
MKKLTETKSRKMIFIGWMLLFLFFADIQYLIRDWRSVSWYGPYVKRNCGAALAVLLVVSLLLAIWLVRGTRRIWKEFLPERGTYLPERLEAEHDRQQPWWEKAPVELLVLVTLIGAGFSSSLLIHKGRYSIDWYNSLFDLFRSLFLQQMFFALSGGLFLAGLVLLLVRYRKGLLKDTSLVCKEIRYYKNRTGLEKQLLDQNRLFAGAGLVSGVVVLGVELWLVFEYGLEVALLLLAGILTAVMLFVILRSYLHNSLASHTGKLLRQIHAMAQGEEVPRDAGLPEDSLLYEAACELEHIEDAMKKSVEKQVQAERLKIDLITNVSHDLKTPLTSMVGYTDLLKKEELSAAAADYVDIISVKQEQLKEMIQDLFELSKATSGAEQLQMETLDMKKLLEQIMGDMEDAVTESSLDIRADYGKEPLLFLGDNKKMYRVVQNLLENVLKYSMAGTRVYIETGRLAGKIYMTMKNISAYEMNFAPEEVMERFVRGDIARTTKGHGLGLAIASSFAKNMGGELLVEVDGDLFKATLLFPEAVREKDEPAV